MLPHVRKLSRWTSLSLTDIRDNLQRMLSFSSDDSSDEEDKFVGLEWRDVNFTVYNSREGATKRILEGLYGRVHKGELMGVLGCSGAGKTTFLNILSGRLLSSNMDAKDSWLSKKARIESTEVSGAVAYEKAAFDLGDSDAIKGISAYVMQSDILCPVHTPKEALTFSAKLRLPQYISNADKQQCVAAAMDALKIAKCQNTLIGDEEIPGISGGERKRTSVGVELVTDPNVVFLDEPTSGLDSFTAKKTMHRLRKLCATGKICIATLHQPSAEIFYTLDKLLLLAKGQCVYLGTPRNACPYFNSVADRTCPPHTNPAEHLLETLQSNPQKFIDAWIPEEQRRLRQYPLDFTEYRKMKPRPKMETGICFQLPILMQREWIIVRRNLGFVKLRLRQTVIFSTIMGVLYWRLPHDQNGIRDRFGWLYFAMSACQFLGGMATLPTFPAQRLLVERERGNNMYMTLAYFMTKSLSQLLESAVFALLQATMTYFMVGADSEFWQLYLVTFLMTFGGSSIALFLCCFVNSMEEAMSTTPIIMLPQMLFANYYVSLEKIPFFLRWIQYGVLLRYSVEALAITEFQGVEYKLDAGTHEGFSNGNDYLKSIGTDKDDLVADYVMLGMLSLCFRVAAYFVLVYRVGW